MASKVVIQTVDPAEEGEGSVVSEEEVTESVSETKVTPSPPQKAKEEGKPTKPMETDR